VLRLADQAGVPVAAGRVTLADLAAADEVFLTGTAAEIQPVGRFLDTTYRPHGPVAEALREAYAGLVGTGTGRAR
jgi:branched-chain amino acid aminotransferase